MQTWAEEKETEGTLLSDRQLPVHISGLVGQRVSLASASRSSSSSDVKES